MLIDSISRFDLRYPGQQYDKETGLHYNHHRHYDPYLTVGYLEADPMGLAAGWNRFTCVGGNPISFIDPKGLDTEVCYYPGALGGKPGWPHNFTCVNGDCAGWYPSSTVRGKQKKDTSWSMSWSDGMYFNDNDDRKDSYCVKPPSCDQQKMDQCVLACRNNPPLFYNLFVNNCASAVQKCVSYCQAQSCIK